MTHNPLDSIIVAVYPATAPPILGEAASVVMEQPLLLRGWLMYGPERSRAACEDLQGTPLESMAPHWFDGFRQITTERAQIERIIRSRRRGKRYILRDHREPPLWQDYAAAGYALIYEEEAERRINRQLLEAYEDPDPDYGPLEDW